MKWRKFGEIHGNEKRRTFPPEAENLALAHAFFIGISGDYSHTIGMWVNFVSPSQKDPEGYVGWNSLSAGPLPDFAKTAAASWTGSVTADVVSGIESQFNAPVDDYVPEWAG